MLSDRKHGPILSMAVILAVLLLLAYVGTYYATVKPTPSGVISDDGLIRIDSIVPQYRISNNGWRRFFSPMHSIDRRIRPRVWTP